MTTLVTIVIGLVLGSAIAKVLLRRRQATPVTASRVEYIDPRELMYSQPSLHDALPALTPGPFSQAQGAAGLLHEDSWLQDELRPKSAWLDTEELVVKGREFAETHRVGLGYRDVFIVPSPVAPIAPGELTVASLGQTLMASEQGSLYLKSGAETARVQNGFILVLPELGYLYGVAAAGEPVCLGLAIIGPAPHMANLEPLIDAAKRFGLELVDWHRFERIDPMDEHALRAWLRRVVQAEAA